MTEPRYILLAEGEKVQEGDEYYEAALERWIVFSSVYSGLEIGNVPIRRKLEGWREIKQDAIYPCVITDGNSLQGRLVSPLGAWATHWFPLPPLPVKQSEAEVAWAEYDIADRIERKAFIAGFEAGRKK